MPDLFTVQGWCPTAWRPMRAQDGWLVRVRPPLASLRVAQWQRLAELAESHALPQIELTRLGNVQLRGVAEADLPALREAMIRAQLVPHEADDDLAPPVHCTPFYGAGDATHGLARRLSEAVTQQLNPRALHAEGLAPLPSKFGFVVDDPLRHMRQVKADLHLWAGPDGAHGLAMGAQCLRYGSVQDAVAAAVAIARWFARARTSKSPMPTRLQALHERLPADGAWWRGAKVAPTSPLNAAVQTLPGMAPGLGQIVGAPLGRIDAQALRALAQTLPPDTEIRVTPWRSLLVMAPEHAMPEWPAAHWITDAADVRLRVSACTGAPRCTQGLSPTQPLALQLAPHVPANQHVHVSGCGKMCALGDEATVRVCAMPAETPCQATPSDPAQPVLAELEVRLMGPDLTAFRRLAPLALAHAPWRIHELIDDLHLRNAR